MALPAVRVTTEPPETLLVMLLPAVSSTLPELAMVPEMLPFRAQRDRAARDNVAGSVAADHAVDVAARIQRIGCKHLVAPQGGGEVARQIHGQGGEIVSADGHRAQAHGAGAGVLQADVRVGRFGARSRTSAQRGRPAAEQRAGLGQPGRKQKRRQEGGYDQTRRPLTADSATPLRLAAAN